MPTTKTPQPSKKKILVVEDNEERIVLFQQWLPVDFVLVVARSAGRAVQTIKLDAGHVYAGVCLDHDLNEQVIDPQELTMNGRHVVRAVIEHISYNVPILVHSMNLQHRRTMHRMLDDAGFDVRTIPSRQMDGATFLAWVDEVRELFDYIHQ